MKLTVELQFPAFDANVSDEGGHNDGVRDLVSLRQELPLEWESSSLAENFCGDEYPTVFFQLQETGRGCLSMLDVRTSMATTRHRCIQTRA